jgi:glutamyl-tRNA synthetase
MSTSDMKPVRVRLAPSPTGLPHVGTIRNAILDWLLARRTGGQFLLRIEDTDRERYDPAAEQALYDSLRWLGLEYDEGPDVGGPFAPYIQSQRLPHYREAAERLIASGHAYRCFCSRERLQQVRDERQKANIHPYGYDRHCRSLDEAEQRRLLDSGAPYVVRFAVPEGSTTFTDAVRGEITYPNRELDDHVLLKSDGFPTYHLAHVVDDHLMGITHVVRSEEWLPSTPRHVLTCRALGYELPIYVHPALIMGRDPQSGKVSKLSKRHGAVYVGEYRSQGYLPETIVNYLALLGWSPGEDREIMSREEMIERFDVSGLNASPAVFDIEKMTWMNGVYIRSLSEEALMERTLPFLQEAGLVSAEPDAGELAYASHVLKLEQERLKTLAEAPEVTDFFFRDEVQYQEPGVNKWLRKPEAARTLDLLLLRLEGLAAWDVSEIETAVRSVIDELGVKSGEVIHPTRVAVTGRTVGPGLFETLHALGRERVLARLRGARSAFVPAAA